MSSPHHRGLSNAEIGRELFISDTTVKTHVTRLLQKLDLRDRAQAIVLAYQTGLFDVVRPASRGRHARSGWTSYLSRTRGHRLVAPTNATSRRRAGGARSYVEACLETPLQGASP